MDIHLAAQAGRKENVQLLLDRGLNIDVKDYEGSTALHLAAASGSEAVIALLISKGSDIHAKDGRGRTALHWTAERGLQESVQLLLAGGSDVNVRDGWNYGEGGRTALHLAADMGHTSVVSLLLNKGSELNADDEKGRSALHLAAASGHELATKFLISEGANVDMRDSNGRTALHLAVGNGFESTARLLLSNGSDVAAKDDRRDFPGGERTALHLAADIGSKELVQMLLENEAPVNDRDASGEYGRGGGRTPLHLAAESGHEAIVRLLLDYGANTRATTGDPKLFLTSGQTPLELAAKNGHVAVVQLLSDRGAGPPLLKRKRTLGNDEYDSKRYGQPLLDTDLLFSALVRLSLSRDEWLFYNRLCIICRKVMRRVNGLNGKRVGYGKSDADLLGTFTELNARNHCPTCSSIVSAFVAHGVPMLNGHVFHFHINQLVQNQEGSLETEYHRISYGEIRSSTHISLDFFGVDEEWESHRSLQLVPISGEHKYNRGGAQLYNPLEIDIELVRKWIHDCDAHSACDSVAFRIHLPLPSSLLLIDIKNGMICGSPGSVKYAALSYVWGSAPSLRTMKANIEQLKVPGSILPDSDKHAIPVTIRDAMRLLARLEIPYLWVDCLCIIQDQDNMRQTHLDAMASIYGNAYLTIVAAEGTDASHGIPGVGGGSSPRKQPLPLVTLSGHWFLACRRLQFPSKSKWASRGWTFQEAVFSRRMLIFDGLVSWTCQSCSCQEDITERLDTGGYNFSILRTSDVRDDEKDLPSLRYFGGYVQAFNLRELTFQGDVIDSFAGVISVMNGSFPGRFYYGLPVMYFDTALLWQPKSELYPRTTQNRAVHVTVPSQQRFPSWSWVGWQEGLDLTLWNANPLFESSHVRKVGDPALESDHVRELDIEPLVDWYVAPGFSVADKIPTSFFKYRKLYTSGFAPHPPPGWETENRFVNLYGYNGSYRFYTHSAFKHRYFRHPIPLWDDFAGLVPPESSHLYTRTTRAWLKIGDPLKNFHRDFEQCVIVSLCDFAGQRIGCIRLNLASRRVSGPDATISYTPDGVSIPLGHTCEVIAISTGKFRGKSKIGDTAEILLANADIGLAKPRMTPMFYNVLWIEWEDGIAYRKALGHVRKEAWDQLPLEKVEVILG